MFRKFSPLLLTFFILLVFLTSAIIVLADSDNASSTPQSTTQLLQQLRAATDSEINISYHSVSNNVRFIGTDLSHPIAQPTALKNGATSEDAARSFLGSYGTLFGITNADDELSVMRVTDEDRGRSFVRFQQTYQGVPLVAGEVIVQLDMARNVVSVSAETLAITNLSTTPTLTADTARATAVEALTKWYGYDDFQASQPALWVYNPTLLKPERNVDHLVWRMELTSPTHIDVRELVLVDAHLGVVALNFNQVDTALNRQIHTNCNTIVALPGTLHWSEGDPAITAPGCDVDNDAVNAHDYAGATYNFYDTNHGRDSLDDAGLTIIQTIDHCVTGSPCPFVNAFWNGTQMAYGDGFASADDVVAHELTHGVTEFESHLFYYYQSGGINEAFSDIWGEFVDLTSTNGNDDDSAGVRWQMGEDLPGIGAIRNMEDPTIFGDPDRVGSPNFFCAEGDSGGVHINSGVANKATFLMVDGGTFNGQTVTALGLAKTADIFYEVQTNLLISGSDYQDLGDALNQACTNLIGTGGITAADCVEVSEAVLATEMAQAACLADDPPFCADPTKGPNTALFSDDLENTASGNWASVTVTGATNEWNYPANPNSLSFDAQFTTSGTENFWGFDSNLGNASYAMEMTGDVAIPAVGTDFQMFFNHSYGFDDGDVSAANGGDFFDGGVLEFSTNGGTTWNDAGALMQVNGYRAAVTAAFGNPIGGRQAFVGESNGYHGTRLTLDSLTGQNVRFRFLIGVDNVVSDFGWFVDDISIYQCVTATAVELNSAETISSNTSSPAASALLITLSAMILTTTFISLKRRQRAPIS